MQKNLRKRFVQHRSDLRLNKYHSLHFQNAYNKYGENDFIYNGVLCGKRNEGFIFKYYDDIV